MADFSTRGAGGLGAEGFVTVSRARTGEAALAISNDFFVGEPV